MPNIVWNQAQRQEGQVKLVNIISHADSQNQSDRHHNRKENYS